MTIINLGADRAALLQGQACRFEEEIQGSIKKIDDKKKERRKDEDEVDGKRGEEKRGQEKREDDKI